MGGAIKADFQGDFASRAKALIGEKLEVLILEAEREVVSQCAFGAQAQDFQRVCVWGSKGR